MKAIILKNFQNDFMSLGAQPIEGAESMIEAANQMMEQYDMVIAIQKWYPANHKMFAANHPWRKPEQELEIDGEKVELKIMHCVSGSFGAAFHKDLNQDNVNYIIQDLGTGPNAVLANIKQLVLEHKVAEIDVFGPNEEESPKEEEES